MQLARGTTFAVAGATGDVRGGHEGFFWGDTRVLSRWVLTIDGAELEPLACDDDEAFAAEAVLVPPRASPFEAAPLSVVRRQLVDEGGWLEELLVISHRGIASTARLRLDADADFADLFEVKAGAVRAREVERAAGDEELVLRYASGGFRRALRIAAPGLAADLRGLEAELALGPHEHRTLTVRLEPGDARPGGFAARRAALVAERDAWAAHVPAPAHDWPDLRAAHRRGVLDLAALRLAPDAPVPAAGLPWFMALFGRDALLTSLMALPVLPALAPATLRALAAHQAPADDDARDARAGGIPHELRHGELSATGEAPFGPYYGSADATALWLVLLEATGDDALARELEGPARAALGWLGDGFLTYERRAPGGLEQQSWKDSPTSMRFADGTPARGPIAACEVQGYAYDARVRASRLARGAWRDPALADRLDADAARLRTRFHEAFWLPDREAYALALDGEGRPVDSLTSNIGHLLWSGIVDPGPAAALARHLTGPELFSGWGVRTMGAREGGFNPLAYHEGTVWPHDTALCAAGLARAGFRAGAEQLATALIDAAAHFPGHRLPEVFAGFPRALTRAPVRFPTASSPQAWAAAAPLLVSAVLGA